MNRLKLFIPLGIFIIIGAFLYHGLSLEPSKLPSTLISQLIPEFKLSRVTKPNEWVTQEDMKGEVALINVWATWCPPCRIEHPQLVRIANQKIVPIYGVNYKDRRENALQFLDEGQDPYKFSAFDNRGTLGIDLGVYGAPETFVVDKTGTIRCKHVGIISEKIWLEKIKPVVESLQTLSEEEINEQSFQC